ncbi:MAG: ferritin [Chlorobi bacterium]|nr:ferritin [Chlorobiota bacterium]
MISKKVEDRLNKQIELEGYSSQLYLSMASWAEKSGYNSTAKFLYAHAEEERLHMLKLFSYINDRGGHAIVPEIKMPPSEFDSVYDVFKQIYGHEVMISGSINDLVGVCVDERDFTTQNFLQWYVNEQIEEENLARNILDKLELLGDDKARLFLFERDLDSIIMQNNQTE